MEGYRVLEIKQSVFENNDREADKLREQLKKDKVFLLKNTFDENALKETISLYDVHAPK